MTSVQLFKDIGLNMSMKKTIDFPSKTAQNTWFNSHESTVVNDVAFNKLQNELHLPMDYGSALQYTYVRFSNLDQSGKIYYYFISDCALIDDSTVAFTLVLDPIQTFMCEYELDECMVTREHCDRWGTGSQPIRKTPNNDGVDAFYKVKGKQYLSGAEPGLMMALLTVTSPTLKYHFSQYSPNTNPGDADYELDKGVFYGIALVSTQTSNTGIPFKCKYKVSCTFPNMYTEVRETESTLRFPNLRSIINGEFQSSLPLPDDAIVSFTIVPAAYLPLEHEVDPVTQEWIYIFDNTPELSIKASYSGGEYEIDDVESAGIIVNTTDRINVNWSTQPYISSDATFGLVVRSPIDMKEDFIIETIADSVWFVPTKPTDGVNASYIYEPALYMAPYTSRRIVKESGETILEIPDVNMENHKIAVTSLMSAGGINTCFIHTDMQQIGYGGIVDDTAEGESATDLATTLDVFNDAWKNYVYTKRDTDRQLVSNQAWQRALDNLFFMSYGGALVGSRSASGKDDPAKNGGKGGLFPKFSKNMLGAVGLAAGASIATSLLDAHYMWQNQMIREKQIRNEPTSVANIGDGIQSLIMHMNNYVYVTLQVDDINWERAYLNFKKYGYIVNEFEKPNTSSRKYFNYILTNGAIIKGNIPQAIKDEISAIYDAGITIFHGDYASTLDYEYITKENIERSLI